MKSELLGYWGAFREFAFKSNVLDLAVAVIIGGAFGKVVASLVSDIVMPSINPLIPGGDWREATVGSGIKLGSFAGAIVDFSVVALVLFLVIQIFERTKRHKTLVQTDIPTAKDPRIEAEDRFVLALEKLNDNITEFNARLERS